MKEIENFKGIQICFYINEKGLIDLIFYDDGDWLPDHNI